MPSDRFMGLCQRAPRGALLFFGYHNNDTLVAAESPALSRSGRRCTV